MVGLKGAFTPEQPAQDGSREPDEDLRRGGGARGVGKKGQHGCRVAPAFGSPVQKVTRPGAHPSSWQALGIIVV